MLKVNNTKKNETKINKIINQSRKERMGKSQLGNREKEQDRVINENIFSLVKKIIKLNKTIYERQYLYLFIKQRLG